MFDGIAKKKIIAMYTRTLFNSLLRIFYKTIRLQEFYPRAMNLLLLLYVVTTS